MAASTTASAQGEGDGTNIAATIAALIGTAQKRVGVASMVLSSQTILGAIADARDRGIDVVGNYDGSQMHSALANTRDQSKIALFDSATAGFAVKPSKSYSRGG